VAGDLYFVNKLLLKSSDMFTLLTVLMWLVPCMHVVSGLISFACSCVLWQNCMVMVNKLANRPHPAANACWFVQLLPAGAQ
jgi:hypothetical protein